MIKTVQSNRRPIAHRLLLVALLVWLGFAASALWMHRSPPVTDLIMQPLPGWQLQVWYGTRTMIAHSASQQAHPAVPLIVIFYETPFTGIRLLGRTTLPIWPLALSTALFVLLAGLLLYRPHWVRWRR